MATPLKTEYNQVTMYWEAMKRDVEQRYGTDAIYC
jgi:hypothetical protein